MKLEIPKNSIEKFNLLNNNLIEVERKVFVQYKTIIKHCELLLKNKSIDDYEIELKLSCWKNENRALEDNPFFEGYCNFMGLQRREEYFLEDYNDTNLPELTLENKHCYTFHHLYDHTELTLVEINKIEEVWIEIKVYYQFFKTIKV